MIEQKLLRRSVYLLVFIVIITTSIMFSAISLIIVHPPRAYEDDYFGKDNILFIVIDDLRPALRCYGDPIAVTPNIDTLASSSIIFKNAYAQQALGAPSRISFLTGRRPDSLHLYDDTSNLEKVISDFTTLPGHFKNHGYETLSIGKVFPHGGLPSETTYRDNSWSLDSYWPSTQEYETEPICPSGTETRKNLICPVDVEKQPEGTLPDIQITDYAIEYLRNKSQDISSSVPFFLAVGYQKPHIPFRVPYQYFDLYPDMHLAENHTQSHLPKVAWNPWVDVREMDDIKSLKLTLIDPLPENFQKLIRRGYYAAVSYIDDQVGRLLKALEDTGHAEHTTIVLLGDHGFSLGEHQEWSKYSNFEVSVKVPLIVHVPDLTNKKERNPFHSTSVLDLITLKNTTVTDYSQIVPYSVKEPAYVSEDFIELVDIFPTLSQLFNIAIPPFCDVNNTKFCSEGNSFYPVIEHMVYDPEPWIPFSWKTAVFSQYPRPSLTPTDISDKPSLKDIRIMGYSIRTNKFRYTEWVKFDNVNLIPDWPLIISRELYSHVDDPSETINLCDEDEYANTVIALSKRIKKSWMNEMPPGFDNF